MNYLRENNAQLELRVRELMAQINELKRANAALQKRCDDLEARPAAEPSFSRKPR